MNGQYNQRAKPTAETALKESAAQMLYPKPQI
jgi:hypothetical protein